MKTTPDFRHEHDLIASGIPVVAGVDEVGRGPLAGPVTAAAVILDPQNIPEGLNDSKKLSAARRDQLFEQITTTSAYAIAEASVAEIDDLNIYHASHLAMCRAVAALPRPPGHALIDGNKIPSALSCPATAIVKGDMISLSIAAASIIAKVARDRLMVDLAQQHPGYGWEKNSGYPTKRHISALEELGVTPHHRVSFRPVHKILYQG
ncbi:MAG: ribonuclease HII [Paracoccaceae bacterium]